MAASITPVSGQAGDISFGETPLKVKSWTAKLVQSEIDITNKASGGWKELTVGPASLEGSCEYVLDTATHCTGTFPVPFSRTSGTLVLSMNDGTNDGGSFSCTAFIFDSEFSSPVEGVLTVKSSFKSSGEVTYTAGA